MPEEVMPEVKKGSVAICIPCSGQVEPMVLTSFMRMVNHAASRGVKVNYFGQTTKQLIHTARQNLAKGFIGSDAEWSLWLDSDMILPCDTLTEMLKWANALDAKFLTGIYHQRQGNYKPLAMLNTLKNEKGEVIKTGKDKYHSFFIDIPDEIKDAVELDLCGFGCVLIHREVFEKMPQPWFRFLFGDDVPGMKPDQYVSEDFYFCVKARELGYKIYGLPSLNLGHISDPKVITRADYKEAQKRKIEKLVEMLKKQKQEAC